MYYVGNKRIEEFEVKLEKGETRRLKTFVGSKWVVRTASIHKSELMRHEVKEEKEKIKVTEPGYEKETREKAERDRVERAKALLRVRKRADQLTHIAE